MATEIKQRTVYVLTRTNKDDDDDTDIYVGSTSQPLNDRLRRHLYAALKRVDCENNKLYIRMRTVGLQNWEIIPLLSRTCDIKTICEVERKWCGIMHADLNTLSPITTLAERRQQQADYYEANKEAILKRHTAYRETNKEAIRQKRETIKQNKVHYCELCEYACGSNADLQKHLKTSKHFWKYIYSVD